MYKHTIGSFTGEVRSTACLKCAPGTYDHSPQGASTSCRNCTSGYVSIEAQTYCTQCAPGKYAVISSVIHVLVLYVCMYVYVLCVCGCGCVCIAVCTREERGDFIGKICVGVICMCTCMSYLYVVYVLMLYVCVRA